MKRTVFHSIVIVLLLLPAMHAKSQDSLPALLSEIIRDSGMQSEEKLYAGETAEGKAAKDSFYLREVPDTLLVKLKEDPAFAYANDDRYWQKERDDPSFFMKLLAYLFTHDWVKWAVYALFAAILLGALYKIMAASRLSLFYTKGRRFEMDKAEIIETASWIDKISGAEESGDFRLATRYQYLQTLKILDENQLISLHKDATNNDYLDMMKGKKSFEEFRILTATYEYGWYGEFDISRQQYLNLSERFHSFNRQFA